MCMQQKSSGSLPRQTLEVSNSKQLTNESYKSWFTGITTIFNETQPDEENMTLVKNKRAMIAHLNHVIHSTATEMQF